MKKIEQLQKENNILVAALDDHRNFIWHLRDSHNSSEIERFLEDDRQLDVYVDCLKAQAIEDVVSLFLDGSCYDPVLDVRDNIIDYANQLRGEWWKNLNQN